MPWVGLRYVIVVFPDHTDLTFGLVVSVHENLWKVQQFSRTLAPALAVFDLRPVRFALHLYNFESYLVYSLKISEVFIVPAIWKKRVILFYFVGPHYSLFIVK